MATKEYEQAKALMGKRIVARQKLVRDEKDDGTVTWTPQTINGTVGWVTGIRWLQVGIRQPGGEYASGPYEVDYAPPYFEQKGTIPCLLVVPSATRNPLKVPFSGFLIPERSSLVDLNSVGDLLVELATNLQSGYVQLAECASVINELGRAYDEYRTKLGFDLPMVLWRVSLDQQKS